MRLRHGRVGRLCATTTVKTGLTGHLRLCLIFGEGQQGAGQTLEGATLRKWDACDAVTMQLSTHHTRIKMDFSLFLLNFLTAAADTEVPF